MRKKIVRIFDPFFRKCGFSLVRRKDYDKTVLENRILRAISNENAASGSGHPGDGTPHFIIFSKDRALQLHALLRSMLLHISGNFHLSILYKVSDRSHAEAYKDVRQGFEERHSWSWVEEHDFQTDLIRIMEVTEQPIVTFLVDDILFIRKLNLKALELKRFSDGILSLRLGSNIRYSYTQRKETHPPTMDPIEGEPECYRFRWAESEPDWDYPLSVDGHFFIKRDILAVCRETHFSAPNSFESALQILKPTYKKRPGYCFDLPRIVNIPLNRVQSEVENFCGNISHGLLLEKWKQGYQLDINALSEVRTGGVHEELEAAFIIRN